MNKLPLARNKDVIVKGFEDEILIYDSLVDKAYCLNETSAAVYRACDGKTTFRELKKNHKFSDDLIFLALDELKAKKLLEERSAALYDSPLRGLTRREPISRVGLASIIALPLITSLLVPTAAMAQSGCTAGVGPGATQGLGGGCACPDPTPAGVLCGAGAVGTPGCKTGCVCRSLGICIGSCLGQCE